MNWEQIKGDWKQLSAKLREKWSKLTKEDLAMISGSRIQLVTALERNYGYEKERAEMELDKFIHAITS